MHGHFPYILLEDLIIMTNHKYVQRLNYNCFYICGRLYNKKYSILAFLFPYGYGFSTFGPYQEVAR